MFDAASGARIDLASELGLLSTIEIDRNDGFVDGDTDLIEIQGIKEGKL